MIAHSSAFRTHHRPIKKKMIIIQDTIVRYPTLGQPPIQPLAMLSPRKIEIDLYNSCFSSHSLEDILLNE